MCGRQIEEAEAWAEDAIFVCFPSHVDNTPTRDREEKCQQNNRKKRRQAHTLHMWWLGVGMTARNENSDLSFMRKQVEAKTTIVEAALSQQRK